MSRGVVVEAYQQLVAEGYLTSRSGGYTRVAIGREPPGAARRGRRQGRRRRIDFGYGRADGSQFPRAAWLRSIRRVLAERADDGVRLRRAAAASRSCTHALADVPQPGPRHVGQAGRTS